ncbi:MAG: mechanosensitive ion channel family protein [Thermoplasmatales archaeon]|nr:mechanosensitive ion channel family protein [Thermoplasmatales archaeon]MCW6169700.1 mechanosensitive ion channel family protein [Thermoplasmatales archaeon]
MVNGKKVFYYIFSLFIIAGVAILIIYFFAFLLKLIPTQYVKFVYAAIIATTGFIVIFFVNNLIRHKLSANKSMRKGRTYILFLINILAYFVLSVAILASLGVNVYSVIVGGAFLSVILGLAVQGVLGNIASGLLITITKPFKLGDKVWVLSWNSSSALITLQFSIFLPKYFSADALFSQGISGQVQDISLNYTKLKEADGNVVVLPNSIVSTGAFVFLGDLKSIRIRYEVPKSLSPDFVYAKTEECLSNFLSKINSKSMFMDETTLNTYVMIVSLHLSSHELITTRSDIINEIKVNLEKFRIKVSPIQD